MTADRIARLLELGRHQDALRHASVLLASEPDNAMVMVLASRARLEADDPRGALEMAQCAVASEPGSAAPLVALANAHERLGDVDAAVESARAALAIAPHDRAALHALIAALAGSKDPGAIRTVARRLYALAPDAPSTHLTIGYAFHALEPETARGAYQRCLQLDPANAVARQNLAALDSRRHTFDAMEGFADALALDPSLTIARQNLGQVVTRWACVMVVVFAVLARVLFHDAEKGDLPGLLFWFVVIYGLVLGGSLFIMPRSVRRALPGLLGLRRRRKR